MNGICLEPYKYSAIALPFIALGLVNVIQGTSPTWQQHFQPQSDFPPLDNPLEEYYNYYKNKQYDSPDRVGVGKSMRRKSYAKKNATSRDYTPQDDAKTVSMSLPKPTVVAYRRSLHNVSWAVTIPLFTFLLPIAGSGDPVSLGNQALYGFFSALIVIIGFAVPILFNGQVPDARSLDNSKLTLNHLMHPGHLLNMVGVNMQNQVGIDPMRCLQKTVCEAYRSPQNERYGMLAWPVRYMFPAKNGTDENLRSVYEIAARDGKFTDESCKKKYNCMFDVLDLASYFLSTYKRARKEAKEKDTYGDLQNDNNNL